MEKGKAGILRCSCKKDFYYMDTASDVLVQILRVINHLQGPPHNLEEPRWFRSTEHRENMRDRKTGKIIRLKRII